VEKLHIRHPFADKIELTLVHHTFEADAFFPIIKEEEWVLQQSELQLRRQASI
jgi:dihydrofolate reductase